MLCRMAWIFLKMIQWISSDENAVRKSRGKAVRLELKICDGTTQRVFLIFSSSWGYSLLVIHCSGRWRRMEKNNNNVRKEWLLITVNQPTAKARPKRALRCVAIGPPFTTTLHSNSDLDFFFLISLPLSSDCRLRELCGRVRKPSYSLDIYNNGSVYSIIRTCYSWNQLKCDQAKAFQKFAWINIALMNTSISFHGNKIELTWSNFW